MQQITWYFDVVSPYAYLAMPAIEALTQDHDVAMRPVVLGAMLAHWGQLGPAEVAPKRLHTYRHCQFLADQAGMAFRFPPRHPFRSLDALRLLTAKGATPPTVRAVFDFIWAEGRDPSAPGELAALATSLGIAEPDRAIAETGAKDLLRAATDVALAAGVFGVPTLAIGDALFWGVDALPMARAYLGDPALLARGEMARLASLPSGVERRPAG